MGKRGFSFVEMMVVVALIGIMAAIGFPRIRDALLKQNVRSARAATQGLVVKTRAVAVARGCRATLHLASGGAMWVTACRLTGAGLDTLGLIEQMGTRYNVSVTPSRDSLVYDSRGLNSEFQQVVVRFSVSSLTDSTVINALGKVMH
jgi:prepilin-type N-terminal cleavage/methylation domain-containing protein